MSAETDRARPGRIDADLLAAWLVAALGTGGPDRAGVGWLWPMLLRGLARGHPVTVDELAHAAGCGLAEVHAGLNGLSDTEYDERGAVVGHGITLRETPHRFTVDGQVLHTWCALDTLILPTVLGRPAQVMSPTPGSGEPVRLSVDPVVGVTALDPGTAVVSVLVPDRGTGVRAAFCNQVHFFATPAAARDWLAEHPGGAVLSVGEAFELGARLAHDLLGDHPGPGAQLRSPVNRPVG